jgi:hypothetical protein
VVTLRKRSRRGLGRRPSDTDQHESDQITLEMLRHEEGRKHEVVEIEDDSEGPHNRRHGVPQITGAVGGAEEEECEDDDHDDDEEEEQEEI